MCGDVFNDALSVEDMPLRSTVRTGQGELSHPDWSALLQQAPAVVAAAFTEQQEYLERRARHDALSVDVSTALAEGRTLRPMLQRCVEALVRHLDAAFARIWTIDDHGELLELQASAGLYTHLDGAHGRVPVGELKIGRIAQARAPHLTNDVQSDPEVSDHTWAKREGMIAFAGYPLTVEDRLVGVMALFARQPLPDDTLAALAPVANIVATGVERLRVEAALREESETLDTINRVSRLLSAELDLEQLVQVATDAATELSGAQFGAFFYNAVDDRGEMYTLYTISGVPREAFSRFPMPRNTPLFEPTFRGEGIIRVDNVRTDPRYGKNPPRNGMPPGHLPVVSYLAVPVISRAGEVYGGLFFGHERPGVFTERAERIVVGLAAQVAIAMDNARLYADAQRSIRLRDEFLTAAAHDLKTPLAGIKGLAQLLHRRASGLGAGVALAEGLAQIDAATTRMTGLVNDLLDLTRLQMGRPLDLDRRPTDLIELVREVVTVARVTTRRHTLEVDAATETLIGEWDERRLARVLENLVGNAIKYSPAGGAVTVRIRCEAIDETPWAVVAVRDEGIGIPAADLPRIFERFHRGANATGRLDGTGIGLASARHTVQSHGGTIAVESREGVGSTFTVRLPLASCDEAPRANRAEDRVARENTEDSG